jgi:hypothetical protein
MLRAACCMLRAALRYALHRLLLCQVSVCVLPPSLLVVSGVLTGAAEGSSVDRCTVSETAAGATGRTPTDSLGHSSVLYRTTTAVLAVWCSVASQCLHGLYTAAEGTGAVKSTGDSIGRRISLALLCAILTAQRYY